MPAVLALVLTLLVFCFVAGILLWIARLVITAFPIPQPFANIAYAICLLLILVLFLSEVGWMGPVHGWRTWR